MAALWATIVSYVLGVPARYYAYAVLAVVIFFVGCHCGHGFGISPQKADPSVVLVEHADPCPVNGSNCTCGCVSGGQCNCALTQVAAERLTRLNPQALAYRDLCEWAKAHPGQYAIVYVGRDVPADISDEYMQVPKEARCRYDAGWPTVKAPTAIYASYRHGEFVEVFRSPPAVRAAQFRQPVFQPFANFGGACAGGRCR